MPWKQLLIWARGQIDKVLRQKLEFVLQESPLFEFPDITPPPPYFSDAILLEPRSVRNQIPSRIR
jgi:hypothetical protein